MWREHFSKLLLPEDSTDMKWVELKTMVLTPDQEEIRTAISRLKNNKATGADRLPAVLFKTVGEELINYIHQSASTRDMVRRMHGRGLEADHTMPIF